MCAFVGHIVTMVPSADKYTSEPTVNFDSSREDCGGACHIEKWPNLWETTVKTVSLVNHIFKNLV